MISRACISYVLYAVSLATFAQDNLRGLEWEDEFYNNLPLKISYFRPRSSAPTTYSIKQYCPRPANQSSSNTSVAWAAVWYGRTMLDAIRNGWKDNALITRQAFSPLFNYRLASSDTAGCDKAVALSAVLESLHRDGAVPFSSFSEFCVDKLPPELIEQGKANRLPGYARLFYSTDTKEKKINAIKEAISDGHPVILGTFFSPTFSLAGEFWEPRGELQAGEGGHAFAVVSYNDSKYGGALEVVNSWGGSWGQGGFTWILYSDIEKYARYGYELLDVARENRPLMVVSKVNKDTQEAMPVQLNVDGLYQCQYSYPTGTKFALNIELNQPAFVNVVGFDNGWHGVRLYPQEEGIDSWVPKCCLSVTIPEAPSMLELFDPPGRNYFVVLISGRSIDVSQYIREIQEKKLDFVRGLNKMPAEEITWAPDKIVFRMSLKRETVRAFLLELDQVSK